MPKSEQRILPGRYLVVPRTLIFIFREDAVLLLKGAAHKRLWANRYNGIGGHIERGEDVHSAARRELFEETGLHTSQMNLCGTVIVDVDETTGIAIYICWGNFEGGAIQASEEGQLEWVHFDRLSHYDVIEDLPIILPRVLACRAGASAFSARYYYDERDQLQIRFG
jgi:8-oxo-dGTP diphosphatase